MDSKTGRTCLNEPFKGGISERNLPFKGGISERNLRVGFFFFCVIFYGLIGIPWDDSSTSFHQQIGIIFLGHFFQASKMQIQDFHTFETLINQGIQLNEFSLGIQIAAFQSNRFWGV